MLEEDRTFAFQGLRLDPALARGCPSGASHGNWAFYADKGAPGGLVGMDLDARSGETVGVSFRDIPQGACTIKLSVISKGAALCIAVDLDEVCSFKERFTRVEGNHG